MTPPQTQLFQHYTKIPFEILIVVLTVLPFFVLAYFYSSMSDHVPLFMTLKGNVAVWGHKSLLSVFRVPLLALVMQVVCVLMKYGTLQSKGVAALQIGAKEEHYLSLNAGLWDWLRWTIAFKMSAESLDTIFLSIERFSFLSRPTFIVTAAAALIGVAGALFYGYRLLL